MIIDQFDEMLHLSKRRPLVFGMSLHPFIVGQPFRLRSFRRAMDHIMRHRDELWITTPGEVAKYCMTLAGRRSAEAAASSARSRDRLSARAGPGDLLCGSGHRDPAKLDDDRFVRDRQRPRGILFREQHRQLLGALDLLEHVADSLDDHRREPERGLIEQEDRRPRHQRPPDRQHLLFAAREAAGTLRCALLQAREIAEHALDVGGKLLARPAEGPDLQVLQHRHGGEHAPAFRRVADAGSGRCRSCGSP